MIDPKTIDKERSQALKQRIDLNRKARFGLQEATPEQLNIIYLICRHLDLDPLEDITLMHGHPWYTVHGTFRMMRRHPEYAGFRQWPLGTEDKLTGGWQDTDIVWATEIRTKSWGPIVQWGKVSRQEIEDAEKQAQSSGKRAAPIATNYVEMAQKRSAQHAIRAAFGHEAAPDEQQIEQMMVEEIAKRSDPERIRQLSDKYDKIYGGEDDWAKQLPQAQPEAEPEADVDPAPVQAKLEADVQADAEMDSAGTVAHMLSLAWQRNKKLAQEAVRLGLKPRVLRNNSTLADVSKANNELMDMIAEKMAEEEPS